MRKRDDFRDLMQKTSFFCICSRQLLASGGSSSAVQFLFCAVPSLVRRDTHGSHKCSRDDHLKSLPLRSPTRWPVSPGHCWPRVEPIRDFTLWLEGLSLTEAARRLRIQVGTARNHLKSIFEKSGTR